LEAALTRRSGSARWCATEGYLLTPEELATIVATESLDTAEVWPSEEAEREFQLPGFQPDIEEDGSTRGRKKPKGAGRPDVYIECALGDGPVRPRGTTHFLCLVEEKVGSSIHTGQEKRYPDYLRDNFDKRQRELGELVRGICVYLAPGIDDKIPSSDLIGDSRWYAMSFQTLHDHVLVPCLNHEHLQDDMRPLLEHYIRTLRNPVKGEKMAITDEEQEIARAIFRTHKETLLLLAECLSASTSPEEQKLGERLAAAPGVKPPLVLIGSDGQQVATGNTVSQLFKAALRYADDAGKLERAAIPYGKGGANYLLNSEPKHASGKEFYNWTEYDTKGGVRLYIDTNFSRDGGASEIARFLTSIGLPARPR
jgi:hypothetical protein